MTVQKKIASKFWAPFAARKFRVVSDITHLPTGDFLLVAYPRATLLFGIPVSPGFSKPLVTLSS